MRELFWCDPRAHMGEAVLPAVSSVCFLRASQDGGQASSLGAPSSVLFSGSQPPSVGRLAAHSLSPLLSVPYRQESPWGVLSLLVALSLDRLLVDSLGGSKSIHGNGLIGTPTHVVECMNDPANAVDHWSRVLVDQGSYLLIEPHSYFVVEFHTFVCLIFHPV